MSSNIAAGFSTSYIHNVYSDGYQVLVFDLDISFLREMEVLLSPSSLRRNNFQITFCSSMSDVLRHVEENLYELMFISIGDLMPNDASSLLSYINSTYSGRALPYRVALVGEGGSSFTSSMLQVGLCDRILKKNNLSGNVLDILRRVTFKPVT